MLRRCAGMQQRVIFVNQFTFHDRDYLAFAGNNMLEMVALNIYACIHIRRVGLHRLHRDRA